MRRCTSNERRKMMQLKSMSLDKLVALRNQVDAVLAAKVVDQKRSLESELSKLTRFEGGNGRSKFALGSGAKGPVAPKYRNPENPSETWAGRGLKPRWLSAAIKSGKKQEDFLIAGAVNSTPAKKVKKARKARK
jgi:DNA-binding protein H-NS